MKVLQKFFLVFLIMKDHDYKLSFKWMVAYTI